MRSLRAQRPAQDEDAAAYVRARMARISGPDEAGGGGRGGRGPADDVAATSDASTAHDVVASTVRAQALVDRLPLSVRSLHAGLSRAHVAVVVLVLLLGLAGAVIVLGLGRPRVEPVTPVVQATGTPPQASVAETTPAGADGSEPASASPAASATPTAIVVHVAGLVVRPGVVELPAGSRVIDAVEAAGGAGQDADLTPINLARVLSDGEQVVVTDEPPPGDPVAPAPTGDPPAGGGHGTGAGKDDPAPVNLNTATAADLDTLPGIGPTLAQRILDWRAANGPFSMVGELLEVSGIGEQTLADLDGLVTV